MKFIQKDPEPVEFRNWKSQANEDWRPNYNYLQEPEKTIVLNSLKQEQGYICCYCEREITGNDYHIEHFKPKDQNKFPELQLDYSNLLCSCQGKTERKEPLHCGNSKGNWFEETQIISPLDPDCAGRFKYTFDGQILPANNLDKAAKKTIEKLKLDIDKLKDLREKSIEPFLDPILTPDELTQFVQGYLIDKKHNGGKFNEFYTTIKYLFT